MEGKFYEQGYETTMGNSLLPFIAELKLSMSNFGITMNEKYFRRVWITKFEIYT